MFDGTNQVDTTSLNVIDWEKFIFLARSKEVFVFSSKSLMAFSITVGPGLAPTFLSRVISD